MNSKQSLTSFRVLASRRSAYARVPFSDAPTAAIAVLQDGSWIPGVRVESASYSLSLPALLNAYTTAVTLGRASEIAALVLSRPARPEEHVYIDQLPHGSLRLDDDDLWLHAEMSADAVPPPTSACDPTLNQDISSAQDGLAAARRKARRAYVPSSNFPVGAVFETDAQTLIPGVNVEHSDWARILCAERNALGTLQSYGLAPMQRGYLSCLNDPHGTPCGACRQWLAELAPESHLWMERGNDDPERASVSDLLPGSFRGRALLDS